MDKLTPAIRKTIKSLSQPKGRKTERAFATERTKNVMELLASPFALRWLVATDAWFKSNPVDVPVNKCLKATNADMERMTSMKTPSEVIAVFEMPEQHEPVLPLKDQLYLALDGVQDPGNMGTILRLADWFGVRTIYASKDTVDVFNPKCVISTMGSIARVSVEYCDLTHILKYANDNDILTWGTFMEGENIFGCLNNESANGIIVMGNEGNGISETVARMITRKIHIPSYPPEANGAESLNVAAATAITVAEFRKYSLNG